MGIRQRILSILYNLGHISKPQKNARNGRQALGYYAPAVKDGMCCPCC